MALPGQLPPEPATTINPLSTKAKKSRNAAVQGVALRGAQPAVSDGSIPNDMLAFTGSSLTKSLTRSAVLAVVTGVLALRLGRRVDAVAGEHATGEAASPHSANGSDVGR